ncbi:hypothetical protein ACGFZP_12780 [Kitasatospora sp. NPDC048239]|uniref:hypothetical protein n=1 Tax=Kitasatospora sp. NPDC048239 TaxID=3364046 RepID=UPI0037150B7D
MLGRTRRQNAELRERNAWLEDRVRQLNLALGATTAESRQHFALAERISDDRVAHAKQLTVARIENATLVIREGNWSSEAVGQAERLGRALRGCARYRREIARLRRLVDRADALADRAVQPAAPTPEVERLRRDLRQRDKIIRQLQDRIDAYQLASEARDWQTVPAAVAS